MYLHVFCRLLFALLTVCQYAFVKAHAAILQKPNKFHEHSDHERTNLASLVHSDLELGNLLLDELLLHECNFFGHFWYDLDLVVIIVWVILH